jgi:hypothetical protein
MAIYRLYILNGQGKIGSVSTIDAQSDEEAIKIVKARRLPISSEIWERSRHVADVPPLPG